MMAVAGANAIYAAYNGLLPDLLPHEIMGKASGVMTVLNSAGAAIGFVVLGVLDVSISYAYPLYALMTVATVGIVCAVAKETPLEVAAPWSCAELFDSFRITPASHGNFFWVFVIRTLYYTALSVFSFIVLYLRDVTFLEQPLLDLLGVGRVGVQASRARGDAAVLHDDAVLSRLIDAAAHICLAGTMRHPSGALARLAR